MKRIATNAATCCALTSVILLSFTTPGSADGSAYRRHHKHDAPVAYVDYVPTDASCRTGWWQTLRHGHVRPRWGTWCR
ncbi:MAG: hypothetical protein WCA56_24315 [Xanthobacteraceae bacterium]